MADSFSHLMERLRAGDDLAAHEVFHRFARRLVGLARTKLSPQLRAKLDPEDVVQSVYKSFFRRHEAAELELASWDKLWNLLTVITVHKCAKKVEYFGAKRRDPRREASLDTPPPDGSRRLDWQAVDREPTPVEAAMLEETIRQLFTDFNAADRDVLALSLQGCSAQEISEQLRRAERTVSRIRERAKKHREQMLID